jgi:hypothetical protein
MGEEMTGLRAWRRESRVEPSVRIGVVLGEDAIGQIEMRVSDAAYELMRDAGQAKRTLISGVFARDSRRSRDRHGKDEPRAGGGRVVAGRGSRGAKMKRDQGVLVRGVVAGRGFHWQKHVDQTLAGRIELLPSDRESLVNELPLETYSPA